MMSSVYTLTYRMTGDPDSAKDLAQDTFVTGWEKLNQLREDNRFVPWIYQIASNKCLNYLRTSKRTESVEDYSQEISPVKNPEEKLIQNELKQEVLQFMQTLPDQQRLVFELRFYKQFNV